MAQLQSLYNKGLITETEYKATKEVILHDLSKETDVATETIPEPSEVVTEAAETVHEEVETLTEPRQ